MEQFLDVESQHNPGKKKFTQKPLDLSYVEIEMGKMYPVDNHDQWFRGNQGTQGPNGFIFDEANYLPEDIRSYFFEERSGKKYVKFYFHPYDQSQSVELLNYLKTNEIPFTFHESGELKAYSTASKSLIAYDRNTGRSFSLKTSTDGTVQGAGSFEKRPYPTRWSYMVGLLSDTFRKQKGNLKSLDVGWEPLVTGIPAVDQSNSVRLMEGVSEGKTAQISGFVFNDRSEAEKIAARAGMTYDKFWKEAFKIKGRAMAEMGLYLGFLVTSNHAQNFRWELDGEGKLTGKVIFIDLSDGRPLRAIHEAVQNTDLIENWERYVNTGYNKISDDRSIYFSNFFRGDHNSNIPQKWHGIMREGVVERTAEILDLDIEDVANHIKSTERAVGVVSWGIDTGATLKIKRAFEKHLKKLPYKGECYRMIRDLMNLN
ncbi:MAG: hypothetical protein K9K67_07295 [Bacteriovoracaceae bacterium]|nr:hypothetical protein [Bacteriovoracaceae bacterium]